MSDLDNRLILEAMSRRGFLGTLSKAAAAAGINPKLPIPNLKDDDDDVNDYDDEGFDVQEWILGTVLDHTVDHAIGDVKISRELANNIYKELYSNFELRAGDNLTTNLAELFDDLMTRETSLGHRFYKVMEDPEFNAIAISMMSDDINHELNLPQIIAKAAAKEAMGHKQEDIMKDVKADLEDPNRIEYSKFDTAGGTREYNYTADSFIMSDKDSNLLSEAYLTEIMANYDFEQPQDNNRRHRIKTNLNYREKPLSNITIKGSDLDQVIDNTEEWLRSDDQFAVFRQEINKRLKQNGYFIGAVPIPDKEVYVFLKFISPNTAEIIKEFSTWEDAEEFAKGFPDSGISNV